MSEHKIHFKALYVPENNNFHLRIGMEHFDVSKFLSYQEFTDFLRDFPNVPTVLPQSFVDLV